MTIADIYAIIFDNVIYDICFVNYKIGRKSELWAASQGQQYIIALAAIILLKFFCCPVIFAADSER